MKKSHIFRFFAVIFMHTAALPFVADAAYPAYPGTYNQPQVYSQPQVYRQPQVYSQPQVYAGQPVYSQPQVIRTANRNVATSTAQPTRITGALPRTGTSNTTAGRQYYQPQTFDRLSDSGLYIGLSLGYTTAVNGGIQADYRNEDKAWFVPGAFQKASFKTDTVLPIQVSVGAAINNDFRVDFSYTRYSGISYPDSVKSGDDFGGFIDTAATGGGISSSATMLNVYYNIDSYTGTFSGGSLRPYIGAGVGISTNTISDYLIYDPNFYAEVPDGSTVSAGLLTAVSDIYAYHAGGTTEQLAYMLEAGVTTELGGGIKMDFFARYAGMGKVQSSGSIVVSQTEWLSTGIGIIGEAGAEEPAPYDSVFHYTDWFESGSLGVIDVGVRLRLQF